MSKSLKKFSKSLRQLAQNKQIEMPAFLGNRSGTVRADDMGNVYVTLFNGEVVSVYNNRVPPVSRLPVVIGYTSPESNRLEVLRSRDVYVTPPYPDVPGHASLHTFPGADTIPIRGEQFLPGLVTPKSGLTLRIYGINYELADGEHVLATQDLDLTSSVPASGAKYARLEADDSGAVTISLGSAVDARGELEYSDIPAPDPEKYSLAAVKLYAGQTSFVFLPTDTDIIDLRFGRYINVASAIHAATEDTAPEDTDEFGFWDSVTGLLNRITWANIKATLKTYFDTLYVALTGNQTIAGVKTFTSDPIIPDEAYDATAWNGSMEPPTKNAVRDKIESMGTGGGTWGSITGTLSDQTDLQTALNGKQPLDDELTAIAGLTSAADRLPYFTGLGAAALATFTSFGRTLLALTNPSAIRFLKVNADNTISFRTAAEILSDIGAAAASHTHSASDITSGTIDNARLDSDLNAIAGLSPSNDDIIQRKSGAWTNRTLAQLATDMNIASGTWTPTGTTGTNVAAMTVYQMNYIRIGSHVFFNGLVAIDTTTTGAFTCYLTLPIASNFNASTDANGNGTQPGQGGGNNIISIREDQTNDRLQLDGYTYSNAETFYRLVGGYIIK